MAGSGITASFVSFFHSPFKPPDEKDKASTYRLFFFSTCGNTRCIPFPFHSGCIGFSFRNYIFFNLLKIPPKSNNMKNSEIISTWEKCYSVSLSSVDLYKKRLRELSTWDKPNGDKKESSNDWIEWACKKTALRGLILEQYPNTVFTQDHKTILKA